MRQGTLCFKEYKNGDEELYNYSDLHISCKYGFCEWGQTPVQVGTITDASLQTSATYGFITISGDSQNIVANWDETQHVDQDPVIYDVVITVNNMKINKFSKGDPDTAGWYSIGDCQTIDGYEENPIYFSPDTTDVYDLETQEETKAWSTTEPYFGTGVIADGAYFSSLNNYYIIIDGTNHPGELSFSQSDSWDSDNVQNYSKQTSGSMFYMWRSTDITECTVLNHYTWDSSNVKLCYDNTTELTVNGVTYTKQNPGPQPTEKHIYLCNNSGAHLAEMSNTGSTWNVTGSFTSGMYSIRATVEGEYNDAWFKFYQTQGDNRIFVGAGDDPSFEDIGTYIMIDDILTSFSLTEDQETGYYVVTYQNTAAMTTSMVDTIVNSYIGDFVTSSDISAMGYMTQTDISSMGYMTATDISAMSYVDSTSLSNMSYVDQTSLSAMSYVDNSYLSTYMNNVVGNIESILQTI